jgi:hypothetical protein
MPLVRSMGRAGRARRPGGDRQASMMRIRGRAGDPARIQRKPFSMSMDNPARPHQANRPPHMLAPLMIGETPQHAAEAASRRHEGA